MSADLVRRIHATPTQFVLAVTGGGSTAISALLQVPGASRTFLEGVVPYSSASLVAWLGHAPEHFCSERTARAMAMVARQRARQYADLDPADTRRVCGVGCTASLASDRPKHGQHRVHVALQTESLSICQTLELLKGARTRRGEEATASAMILNLLAEACGLSQRAPSKLLKGEEIVAARAEAPLEWRELHSGRRTIVAAGHSDRPCEVAVGSRRVVFPGAFDPRHDGHRGMARLAAERLGLPVEHEISILNVDKPPMDFIDMQHRREQFAADEPLWFTRAATFVEKSALFPNTTFIVGADTIARIAEARYYGDDPHARDRAIDAIAAAGCGFLVVGRQSRGRFLSLSSLELPPALSRICDEVSEEAFRADISSKELRRALPYSCGPTPL
ncbi:MAG TPA: CinA family protein [Pirellulales bacterium]|nr:CinA family protein [Pirellulales bacterium]